MPDKKQQTIIFKGIVNCLLSIYNMSLPLLNLNGAQNALAHLPAATRHINTNGPGRTPSRGGLCMRCRVRFPLATNATRAQKLIAYHEGKCSMYPMCKPRLATKANTAIVNFDNNLFTPVQPTLAWTVESYLWAIITNMDPTTNQLSIQCNTQTANVFLCAECCTLSVAPWQYCDKCTAIRTSASQKQTVTTSLHNAAYWTAQETHAAKRQRFKSQDVSMTMYISRANTPDWAIDCVTGNVVQWESAKDERRVRMLAQLTCYVTGVSIHQTPRLTPNIVHDWAVTKIARWWRRHQRKMVMNSIVCSITSNNSMMYDVMDFDLKFSVDVTHWTSAACSSNVCAHINKTLVGVCAVIADIPRHDMRKMVRARSTFWWPKQSQSLPMLHVQLAFVNLTNATQAAICSAIDNSVRTYETRVQLNIESITCYAVVNPKSTSLVTPRIGNWWGRPVSMSAMCATLLHYTQKLTDVCAPLHGNEEIDACDTLLQGPYPHKLPRTVAQLTNKTWLLFQPRRSVFAGKTLQSGRFILTMVCSASAYAYNCDGALAVITPGTLFSCNGCLRHVRNVDLQLDTNQTMAQLITFEPPFPSTYCPRDAPLFWQVDIPPKMCSACKLCNLHTSFTQQQWKQEHSMCNVCCNVYVEPTLPSWYFPSLGMRLRYIASIINTNNPMTLTW